MSLELDARRRAMLHEMGVHVFEALPAALPPTQAVPVRAAVQRMPAPRAPLADPAESPVTSTHARHSDVADLDWDALQKAVAEGAACALCAQQGASVFGSGHRHPDWLVIGDPPDEAEEREGEPFVGEAGTLLNNMLRAVGVDRSGKVYLTHIIKCRPPGNRNPTREEMAQCEPILRRQVQLLQPKVILLMGRFAVPSLLETQEPIGKLRGRAHDYQGIPVVVTYHPANLLRNLPHKANAWDDLCLARELVQARSPAS